MQRTKFGQMDEDITIDACFDYFRRKGSSIDVLWVKEQVYRTSCVPERCPPTRSLHEIFSACGGDEEGEVVKKDDVDINIKFRFN